MNNRRDFLRFFGVGATVVPLIEGMPSTENQAVILVPPAIEIPKPSEISVVSGIPDFGACDVVVFLRDQRTRAVTRLDCTGFVMEWKTNWMGLGRGTEFVPDLTNIDISLKATGPIRLLRSAPEFPSTPRRRLPIAH